MLSYSFSIPGNTEPKKKDKAQEKILNEYEKVRQEYLQRVKERQKAYEAEKLEEPVEPSAWRPWMA